MFNLKFEKCALVYHVEESYISLISHSDGQFTFLFYIPATRHVLANSYSPFTISFHGKKCRTLTSQELIFYLFNNLFSSIYGFFLITPIKN